MNISKSIFREYDIRGIVKSKQDTDGELNEQSVKLLGYFLGKRIVKIAEKSNISTPYVSLGYDARTHGLELFDYLTSGLNQAGCKVLNMGMVATGVNYFSNYIDFEIDNKQITTTASIMITGSHNPSNYNGFKITVDKAPFFGDDI
jgi:phosphomannomutase/phosphoglucomutase